MRCLKTVPHWGGRWMQIMTIVMAFDVTASTVPTVPSQPLTVAAAIETTRFMVDHSAVSARNPDGAVSLSPDGRHYVVRLIRGDVERDGVWMELLAGRATSIDEAAQLRTVMKRFSTGLGTGEGRAGAEADASAQASPLQWIDDEQVAFLWSDEQGVRQVVRLNLRSGRTDSLTQHATSVVSFHVSPSGAVLYCAHAPLAPANLAQALTDGFVIEPQTDATSLMQGRVNQGTMADRLWATQWFVRLPGDVTARHVRLGGRDQELTPLQRGSLSPDGTWALINGQARAVPPDWERYEEPSVSKRVRRARLDATSFEARILHQLWLLNTRDGSSQPLWDAVADVSDIQTAWSRDNRFVAVAPTFLPLVDADVRARRGTAAAVVERSSGRYERLPVDLAGRAVVGLRWLADDQLELQVRHQAMVERVTMQRRRGTWSVLHDTAGRAANAPVLKLRQDLNTPPALVAVDDAGRERVILDPNPGLAQRYRLGRVERIEGRVASGEVWEGLLFYPSDYQPGRRYPLLIQSVYGGSLSDEFTLYGYQHGYGLGPTFIAPYPGRLLSDRGAMVLHLDGDFGEKLETSAETELRRHMFENAAEQLIDAGLVDRQRVGLAGFSRNGFYVEYTLTHSAFPFAAAVAADNWDASYVAQTLAGYDSGGIDVNGAAPFGDGLRSWLQKAPGFGAEHVRAPLLKIEQSNALLGVLLKWELYARLRHLKKPVEYYVMPNAQYGVHNTQNPSQIRAVQQRSLDWFDFWLNGKEDPSAQKQAQYVRWRTLRELQISNTSAPVDGQTPSTAE